MSSTPPCLIVIPARLQARRLARKPLLEIGGKPMLVQVWERACAAKCGDVLVAAAEQEIADVIQAAGGDAVLTPPDLPSGTDRVFAAVQTRDPQGRYQHIINLQSDLPSLPPPLLAHLVAALTSGSDIATPVCPMTEPSEIADPHVVKVAIAWDDKNHGRALYFSRAAIPFQAQPSFHHIGIYAYQREALSRFAALPSSPLEQLESLEQLRALEAGMRIQVVKTTAPVPGVDTPDDLVAMREHFARNATDTKKREPA